MAPPNNSSTPDDPPPRQPPPPPPPPPLPPKEEKTSYLQKLWQYRKYLIIEPYLFFYVMASVLNAVAMSNFPLLKACRVNLGYNEVVCENILDKSILGIDCDELTFENTTMGGTPELLNLTVSSDAFNYTVCKAEIEAQTLTADVRGKRAPIAAIFTLIVLLFAGSWSDRYNKRKPCMILAVFGEGLMFVCLFIGAVFFYELPMEFSTYTEGIVPAIFGGFTSSLMAIYSYITIATPEEDRLFRFGILAIFINALPFLQPLSGTFFRILDYTLSFAMGVLFQIIAILYIIFFIDEVTPAPKAAQEDVPPPLPTHAPPDLTSAADNLAYESTNIDDAQVNKTVSFEMNAPNQAPNVVVTPKPPVKRSWFREFFDPTLALECAQFPFIKRKNNGRMLLGLLIIGYFLTVSPTGAEGENLFSYTLKRLSWNADLFTYYNTFSSAAALVGTFIATSILSKMLKVSDAMIGLLSAAAAVISRIIFVFARDTTMFYVGGVVEMFVSLRVIAIKAIGANIVDGEDLSKMYSIFGITEPIGQFVFPPIYSEVYQSTVNSFPGAIFVLSIIFFVPNIIVFLLCYFILRHNKRKETKAAVENGQNGNTTPDCEITSL